MHHRGVIMKFFPGLRHAKQPDVGMSRSGIRMRAGFVRLTALLVDDQALGGSRSADWTVQRRDPGGCDDRPVLADQSTEDAPTRVVEAYDQMMRRFIGPALRQLGFSRTLREFRYGSCGQAGGGPG